MLIAMLGIALPFILGQLSMIQVIKVLPAGSEHVASTIATRKSHLLLTVVIALFYAFAIVVMKEISVGAVIVGIYAFFSLVGSIMGFKLKHDIDNGKLVFAV